MSIRKNIISNVLLSSSKIIFPLFTFPYITRTLSVESYGSVLFIDAFTQYFIIFSALGVPFYGIREISKIKHKPELRSKLVLELISIKLLLAICFSLIFLLLKFFVPELKNNTDLIKLGCISIISSSFLIEWFYQGMELYAYITKRSVLIKTLSVISVFWLIKANDDKLVYYFILVFANVTNAFINFAYYLRKYHSPVCSKLELTKHLKPLAILFLINIAVSAYTLLNTIILGVYTDVTQVSYYEASLRISKIVTVCIVSVGAVLIPRITSLGTIGNKNKIKDLMNMSCSIVLLTTIPFCCFCMLFPEEILNIVVGKNYGDTENALRILSPLPLIIGLCNVFGIQFLMPIGKEKKIFLATLMGFVISLILNFILTPKIGYIGASIACLCAEFTVFAIVYQNARREIEITLDYGLLQLIIYSLAISYCITIPLHNLVSRFFQLWVMIISFVTCLLLLNSYIKNTSLLKILTLQIR
ncbi:hypothetical protein BCY91_13215 [Pelobium manganitolerans]|uniref:Uncharacterized protein n=1 Tax=Pelobium manganitolerans TaxID=1842495 RepID=A0A419SB87_9SPHI|nr:flippase [Pelobium manganitolerans]RKD19555.1 hypothetical protein BCY91_13215 [Pelobium manganitolerans]